MDIMGHDFDGTWKHPKRFLPQLLYHVPNIRKGMRMEKFDLDCP